MKGILGYGRYDDDPNCIGCPRAKTDMTPCVARDGHVSTLDDGMCVGCGADPTALLIEVANEIDRRWAADILTGLVKEMTAVLSLQQFEEAP